MSGSEREPGSGLAFDGIRTWERRERPKQPDERQTNSLAGHSQVFLYQRGGIMTSDTLLRRLRAECDKLGSQKAFAALHGMTLSYLNDVLQRRREPGPAILNALGLRKVVSYERIKSDA